MHRNAKELYRREYRTKSDIEKFLKDKWMSGRWGFGYTEGWQYSPTIKDY